MTITLPELITEVLEELIPVDVQKEALAALFELVPGITTVYPKRPEALQSPHLPALILFPGSARCDGGMYQGSLRIVREWFARLYVEELETGREFDVEMAVGPFVERLAIAVAAVPFVPIADGRAFAMQPTVNSAAQPLSYNNKAYAGVEQRFTTDVEATVPRFCLAPTS